jgi:hypothetical protein
VAKSFSFVFFFFSFEASAERVGSQMDDYVNDAIEYEDETQVRYHMTSLRAVVDYALERPHFEVHHNHFVVGRIARESFFNI